VCDNINCNHIKPGFYLLPKCNSSEQKKHKPRVLFLFGRKVQVLAHIHSNISRIGNKVIDISNISSRRGQFHQHFMFSLCALRNIKESFVPAGVNFINFLCTHFLFGKCFVQLFSSYVLALAKTRRHICTKNVCITCWWNWPQVSIWSTFCTWLFSTKVPFLAFLYLQFGFVIFCQKNICKKAALKMLMKSTMLLFWCLIKVEHKS